MPQTEMKVTKAIRMLTGKPGTRTHTASCPQFNTFPKEELVLCVSFSSLAGKSGLEGRGNERRMPDLSNSLSFHSLPPPC